MTIDRGGIWIGSNRRSPLDAFVTLVIVLGGGKDGTPQVAKGIKGNNIGVTDSRHCKQLRGRGNGYW
jgi:hypothetical protein